MMAEFYTHFARPRRARGTREERSHEPRTAALEGRPSFLRPGWSAPAGLACLAAGGQTPAGVGRSSSTNIQLPPGFNIEVYADDVPNARRWRSRRTARSLSARGRTAGSSRWSTATRTRRPTRSSRIAARPEHAERRRVPRRRALCRRGQPHLALRRHRVAPGDAAQPVVVNDALPDRRAPRLEVHRASGPTAALRAGRRAVQRLRARRPALRRHHADAAGRHGVEVFASRRAQHGRLRLAPGDRASSGSPTTAATCSATTSRRTS